MYFRRFIIKEVGILFTYKSTAGYSQESLSAQQVEKIGRVDPQIKISAVDLAEYDNGNGARKKQFDSMLAKTEIIFGHLLPVNIIRRAPGLKWIQAMSSGVDMLLNDDFKKSEVVLTNMRGLASIPIAEYVLTTVLNFNKKTVHCLRLQEQKNWKQFHPELTYLKTIGIVGLGNIGREVARLSKAMGMRVIATNLPARRARNTDLVLPPDEISTLLRESDFVVVTVPLTPATHKLINEERLSQMNQSAYFINVSRGKVVDEEALIKALNKGSIAGAALDVFCDEPLPPDSPMWTVPNLIISPHVAAYIADYSGRATDFFCQNLKRYLDHKRLLNVVNKTRGF